MMNPYTYCKVGAFWFGTGIALWGQAYRNMFAFNAAMTDRAMDNLRAATTLAAAPEKPAAAKAPDTKPVL